jgi:hypothetical protein
MANPTQLLQIFMIHNKSFDEIRSLVECYRQFWAATRSNGCYQHPSVQFIVETNDAAEPRIDPHFLAVNNIGYSFAGSSLTRKFEVVVTLVEHVKRLMPDIGYVQMSTDRDFSVIRELGTCDSDIIPLQVFGWTRMHKSSERFHLRELVGVPRSSLDGAMNSSKYFPAAPINPSQFWACRSVSNCLTVFSSLSKIGALMEASNTKGLAKIAEIFVGYIDDHARVSARPYYGHSLTNTEPALSHHATPDGKPLLPSFASVFSDMQQNGILEKCVQIVHDAAMNMTSDREISHSETIAAHNELLTRAKYLISQRISMYSRRYLRQMIGCSTTQVLLETDPKGSHEISLEWKDATPFICINTTGRLSGAAAQQSNWSDLFPENLLALIAEIPNDYWPTHG